MFCFQCEQTQGGVGCMVAGNCGKDPVTSALQDALNALALEVAAVTHAARVAGAPVGQADEFVIDALFTTVTNVNFDPDRIYRMFLVGLELRTALAPHAPSVPLVEWRAGSLEQLVEHAKDLAINKRMMALGQDIGGLQELCLYGLKGAMAYTKHALALDYRSPEIVHEGTRLAAELHAGPTEVDALLGLAMAVGAHNLKVMELLDAANTGTYGHPVPTEVNVEPVAGKCILVSGHDLKDLQLLLEQTAGRGINVYTHGEMLPAHGYPELHKHPHLVGNYGGAWQVQGREFRHFPGAILMTTNCIQKPAEEYFGRIFTSGLVAWPGVQHISDGNFEPVIQEALAQPGFLADEPEHKILVGFGRNAILQHAGAVLEAVQTGQLRHIFLIGGCDGAMHGRNYYTKLAESVPQDCMILTLACGKFRFNKLEFGTVAGLPRLLDVGQCNDAYSAIVVASELAKAVGCGVNDLPLSLVISWFEQKAVAIFLTLLHLGIKNMRLGPTLPAFLSDGVIGVLSEKFGCMPIKTPSEDLEAILAGG